MDIAPTILLATVLWQVIDLLREAAGKQWSSVVTQLVAAKAAQQSARLALDSEIGGVNTTVAQLQA